MFIGFLRNSPKPSKIAKITAMLCESKGIDLVYMQPSDVNIENNTVKGKMFINNEWLTAELKIPKFIDVSPFCYNAENRTIMRYLRKRVLLSDNGTSRLNKEKLQRSLTEDKTLSHLVIPTHKVQSDFSEVETFLNKYHTIVMKPIASQRGVGIYKLTKQNNVYILGHEKGEKRLSDQEMLVFFKESILNKGYILQKYVTSRTVHGDPFDCRIHAEKNGKGEWVNARTYIRVGIGQQVISNVNQGGVISDPVPFLQANFNDKAEEINQKLKYLAVTLPYRVEQLRDTHIMSLGMDIGIDHNGNVYLFEINSAPATSALTAEVANLRTSYYKYVADNNFFKS